MKVRQATVLIVCFAALSILKPANSQAPPVGLQISPSSIDFEESLVNVDAPPHTVTVTNPGRSTIVLEQILTSGIDFSEKHDCGQTLAPGAQCTIQVSFTPAIPGPRTGNLEIMESNGSPHFVALNGTGKS